MGATLARICKMIDETIGSPVPEGLGNKSAGDGSMLIIVSNGNEFLTETELPETWDEILKFLDKVTRYWSKVLFLSSDDYERWGLDESLGDIMSVAMDQLREMDFPVFDMRQWLLDTEPYIHEGQAMHTASCDQVFEAWWNELKRLVNLMGHHWNFARYLETVTYYEVYRSYALPETQLPIG